MNADEEFLDSLPISIRHLVRRGYKDRDMRGTCHHIGEEERREYEVRRRLARTWRNLIGELKYDLPRELWPFVNMTLPKVWYTKRDVSKPKSHDFVILIPGCIPIIVNYRQLMGAGDWRFHKLEILTPAGSYVSSQQEEDLPLFLAVAHKQGQGARRRREVVVEEIQVGGDLAENARVFPVFVPRVTMEDFLRPAYYRTEEYYGA
jgi:hypothetical protein